MGHFVGGTGKSYPLSGKQERRLVRDPFAANHVMDVGGDPVAVLVCHDLNAWSPRGTAVRGKGRATEAAGLDEALAGGHPTTVLHLPAHDPFGPDVGPSMGRAGGRLPTETVWASAIRYRKGSECQCRPLGRRAAQRTRSRSDVLDIVLGDYTSLGDAP